MKKLILILLLLATTASAESIVISEVLYDPITTEAGGEAVELYNPTNHSVDISGWIIKTESSASDATIPADTILQAGHYFLIADSGWSTNKDNASWPNADHEEAISMTNSDAGVALIANGTTISAVGWGDFAGIQAGLFEGTPASHVVSGNSLRRINTTSNNSVDFIESASDLKNSSFSEQSGTDIDIEVEIGNSVPVVEIIAIQDESPEAGIQVIPSPGMQKSASVQVIVSDGNTGADVQSVNVNVLSRNFNLTKQSDNATHAIFSGTFAMEFFDTAGNHTLTAIASDSNSSSNASTTFSYEEVLAVDLDATSVSFTGVQPGNSVESLGDAIFGNDQTTLRNIGNSNLDIGVFGEDLSNGQDTIPVGNIQYSFDNDFGSLLSGVLQQSMSIVSVNMPVNNASFAPIGFKLDVPTAITPGTYNGKTTIVAVAS